MTLRLATVFLLLALLLNWGTMPAAGHATQLPRSSARDLANQVSRPIPGRDLYSLTNQLVLRPPRPIPHVVRHTSPNYPVGHHDSFYVLTEDKNGYFTVHATIQVKTPHLYMYVEDGLKLDQGSLEKAAQRFEKVSYRTDRSMFGSEWAPGVDGDPHITCLVADLKSSDAMGYYSAEDEYPRIVEKYSNSREMFYINSTQTLPGDSNFDRTLAHEFQHMIHWHMHPRDNTWLNEGMSTLAEQVNGFNIKDDTDSFFFQPNTQLNKWELSGSNLNHYGAAGLFLAYLYHRYGRSFTRDLVADRRYTDFELINDVLHSHHINRSANALFGDWAVANELDSRSVARGTYWYPALTERIKVTKTSPVPLTYKGTVTPYTAQYVAVSSLSGAKRFRLSFAAPSTIPLVSFTAAGPFWWSNRGDMSDTRLERDIDLRHVQSAHLHFGAWYEIEKNYDYAYVEASTDGGKTWTTLPGTDTTSADPNSQNYGNAFTGSSSGWKDETVDLSAYAGKRIKLRFQYITDDAVNGQGIILHHISIPEIHFNDDYSGWKPQGFVAVSHNALPAAWSVRLIKYTTHGATVSHLPLSTARGSVMIDPAKEGLKKLVAVIYIAAPKTTVETNYALSAVSSPK